MTVEQIAEALNTSVTTAYRYVALLSDMGFLVPMGTRRYALGPSIIELDHRIRVADPFLAEAEPVVEQLLADAGSVATVILCRLLRDRVMCVAQRLGREASPRHSKPYERGRPMPLLRGAPSKAILAGLPARAAERLWEAQSKELGLSREDWSAFRAHLTKIRKAGVAVSRSEIEPGVVGIAAAVQSPQGGPLAAICTVLPEEVATPGVISRVSALTRASAEQISAALYEREAQDQDVTPGGVSQVEETIVKRPSARRTPTPLH